MQPAPLVDGSHGGETRPLRRRQHAVSGAVAASAWLLSSTPRWERGITKDAVAQPAALTSRPLWHAVPGVQLVFSRFPGACAQGCAGVAMRKKRALSLGESVVSRH